MLSDDVKRFEDRASKIKNKLVYRVGKLSFILLYVLDYKFLTCQDISQYVIKVYGNRYYSKVNSRFIGQAMRYYKDFFTIKRSVIDGRFNTFYLKKK